MSKETYERIYSVVGIAAPVIFFLYLSLNDSVAGVDSWYHVKEVFQTPVMANAYALMSYLMIFGLLWIVPEKKSNAFFIGSLFMLNIWFHRFLEPEVTDYIFIFPALIIISIFAMKNDKIPDRLSFINYKTVAIAGVILYMMLRGWMPFHPYMISDPHPENLVQFSLLVGLIPILSLLVWNRRWIDISIVLGMFLMWPSAKFVLSALYIYGFAIHIDLMKRRDFRYPKHLITALMIVFVSTLGIFAHQTVQENNTAFEKYCDQETLICSGMKPNEYHFGHYFGYLGYRVDNPLEYGVCDCEGEECLKGIIQCGGRENKRTFIFNQTQ